MTETTARPAQRTDPLNAAPSQRMRVWTLCLACLGLTLVISSMVALNTALGDIALSTSASQTELTWVVDSYTLALACLVLPAGAIGDRYGRRGALAAGLLIFAAASYAPAIWADPLHLIVARGVAGVGAAFIMPATLSLITSAYPPGQRAKSVGIWAGVAGSGAVVGMLGSGGLLHFWSWQSIFWAFGIVATVLIPLSLTVATSKDPQSRPLDRAGTLLIGASVAVFVFGILAVPSHGWGDPVVYGCLLAGVALAAAFGVVELRQRHPLLDVRLFGDATFATGAVAITMLFLALFGFFFLLMQHIQLVMGYSAIATAFAISPLVVPMLAFSVLSAWYLPKLGLRLVVFLGLLCTAAGLLCLRQVGVDSPYWDLAWPLLILSTGIGLCTAPTTSAIMVSVSDDKQGVASAVNDATREIGAALGIALAGSILAHQYSTLLSPKVSALPAAAREVAGRSLAESLELATRLGGPQGVWLAEVSRAAFVAAMHSSLLVLAAVLATAAVAVGLWAPGRDGTQLAVIRRIRRRGARRRAGRHHR
ncbi:MFS transporter [Mycolicibacterium palauense]|uniref:MFS transporter n=1 Tax=Mycolicibacterium palauense TaxID=2034511 RepID=UPI0038992857